MSQDKVKVKCEAKDGCLGWLQRLRGKNGLGARSLSHSGYSRRLGRDGTGTGQGWERMIQVR